MFSFHFFLTRKFRLGVDSIWTHRFCHVFIKVFERCETHVFFWKEKRNGVMYWCTSTISLFKSCHLTDHGDFERTAPFPAWWGWLRKGTSEFYPGSFSHRVYPVVSRFTGPQFRKRRIVFSSPKFFLEANAANELLNFRGCILWLNKKALTRWWFHPDFWNFQPDVWGNDPIWRAYFSKGLVQPPTRLNFPNAFRVRSFWCEVFWGVPGLFHKFRGVMLQGSLKHFASPGS